MTEREQIIELTRVDLSDYHIIDVRSPGEFSEFCIAGAQNIPLFDNEERAKVGTMYKQVSKEEAKTLGLSFVSPKLVDMLESLKQLKEENDKPFLIYCARGGMRSGSFTTFMRLMGINCFQLSGGIRTYRKQLTDQLEQYASYSGSFIVMEGLTGTRKTDILDLLQEEGYPVLNLEKMAGHRGSLFGTIGTTSKSQKEFEHHLLARLKEIGDTEYYIIESESKRIGRVMVPDWILKGKETGTRIHVNYPFEYRVSAICEAYQPQLFHDEIGEAIMKLRKRLKPELFEDICQAYENRHYTEVVKQLLEQYYDPKYRYTSRKYQSEVVHVSFTGLEQGMEKIRKLIEGLKITV